MLTEGLCESMAESASWSRLSRESICNESLCIEPLRSWRARPLGWEKDECWRELVCGYLEKWSVVCGNCAGSPCRDGGRLPLRDCVALDGPKYSEAVMLRLSSLGECTEAASDQGPAGASAR